MVIVSKAIGIFLSTFILLFITSIGPFALVGCLNIWQVSNKRL